ncbi:MAG: hypothetical protein RR394_06910 [Oscillospiraceae bacterium]
MASYMNMQAAIDAGTTNMTAVRNNSANDDGSDTIATGITWFYFNSVQVSNLYVSGNSWLGFGTSAEQLKVNRRDAKVYYEYTETGTIGLQRFFKLRWCGFSIYSQTADAYKQEYDVFLLDDGRIYLRWYSVPTNNLDGVNSLVCASETLSFTPSGGVVGEWIFTPANPATGTGWAVTAGRPVIVSNYKSSGTAVYATTAFQSITKCRAGTAGISWKEDKPAGTSIGVSVALSAAAPLDSDYVACVNEGKLALLDGADMSGKTLYVKVALSTGDKTITPSFSRLHIVAEDISVQDFVSNERLGIYKVYCDLANQFKGVEVVNKRNTRLRFASGEVVPPFSVHMFVAGQSAYIDGGYKYEKAKLEFMLAANDKCDVPILWTAINTGSVYEQVAFNFSLNAVDNASVVLT